MSSPHRPVAASVLHRRLRLALSILGQRPFCAHCQRNADDAKYALLGMTIEELAQQTDT